MNEDQINKYSEILEHMTEKLREGEDSIDLSEVVSLCVYTILKVYTFEDGVNPQALKDMTKRSLLRCMNFIQEEDKKEKKSKGIFGNMFN